MAHYYGWLELIPESPVYILFDFQWEELSMARRNFHSSKGISANDI